MPYWNIASGVIATDVLITGGDYENVISEECAPANQRARAIYRRRRPNSLIRLTTILSNTGVITYYVSPVKA